MVVLIAQALCSLQPVLLSQPQAATVRGIFKDLLFCCLKGTSTHMHSAYMQTGTRIYFCILHYSSGDNRPPLYPIYHHKKISFKYLQTASEFYPTVQNSLPHIKPIFLSRSFLLPFFHHYPRRLSYVSTTIIIIIIIIIIYPQGLLPPSRNVFSVFGWQPQHMYTLR